MIYDPALMDILLIAALLALRRSTLHICAIELMKWGISFDYG